MVANRLSPDILTEERLVRSVDPDTLAMGRQLYRRGQVQLQKIREAHAELTVQDKRPHAVEIRVAANYLYLKCSCRHASRGLVCEHEVAAWLFLMDKLRGQSAPAWREKVQQIVNAVQALPRSESAAPFFHFLYLKESPDDDWEINPYSLPLARLFQLRSAPPWLPASDTPLQTWKERFQKPASRQELAEWLVNTPEAQYACAAQRQPLDPQGCLNCPAELMIVANSLVGQASMFSYMNRSFVGHYLELAASSQVPLILVDESGKLQQALHVSQSPAEINLILNRTEDGLHLSGQFALQEAEQIFPIQAAEFLITEPLWVLVKEWVFRLVPSESLALVHTLRNTPDILIPAQEEEEFWSRFLLPLARQVSIQGNAVRWETIDCAPVPRLYLSDQEGELRASLRFAYGENEVAFSTNPPAESIFRQAQANTLLRVKRQIYAEESAAQLLSSGRFGLKRIPGLTGTYKLRARTHPVDFLLHTVPRLVQAGFEIFGEEKLRTARVNRHAPSISFNISTGIDWFDVQAVVKYGDTELALKDLRQAIRSRQRYVKLADGTIGEIPPEWIERYRHLLAFGQETPQGLRLSSHHLALLDQVLAEEEQLHYDAEYEKRRQFLKRLQEEGFLGIRPQALPAGFQGELRPYQKAGLDWLHFLREYHFGGCLADDMGLGKTVQTLVFLLSLYENRRPGQPASLLVVPRSLLVNWQREAQRFTPTLRLLEYFDTDRIKDVENFDTVDVVITTYGVMLRDIGVLHSYTFEYAILDESQVIKNPLSQTAKAARLLRANHRLVLTGTPIENSTAELWSQFSFLSPGFLGSLDYFRREFGTQIEKKRDPNAAQLLRRMVYPFILRRTKAQVAPELPPRTERILYCDMEPAQLKLYQRTRDAFRNQILGLIHQEGLDQARMHILEGLLRLRQISNHPRLVDENYRGGSGKFELLTETLETLQSEGHKALVFSQFVQMLQIVRQELEARQIPYSYLDGSTQNRQERVDEFQNRSDIPFFLISLRAGGLGLNLTAADYVIHIDPWWNPAVEMQASDRTHRIGQDKPVFIFKLIARDSVEEKILLLQERKRNLVDQIITTEASFFKSLTEEDIRNLFS